MVLMNIGLVGMHVSLPKCRRRPDGKGGRGRGGGGEDRRVGSIVGACIGGGVELEVGDEAPHLVVNGLDVGLE